MAKSRNTHGLLKIRVVWVDFLVFEFVFIDLNKFNAYLNSQLNICAFKGHHLYANLFASIFCIGAEITFF